MSVADPTGCTVAEAVPSPLDPGLLAQARERLAPLFRRADLSHPVLAVLFELGCRHWTRHHTTRLEEGSDEPYHAA